MIRLEKPGGRLGGTFHAQLLEDHEREVGPVNTLPEPEPTPSEFDSGI